MESETEQLLYLVTLYIFYMFTYVYVYVLYICNTYKNACKITRYSNIIFVCIYIYIHIHKYTHIHDMYTYV